jgi:hypothetical protein
MADQAGAFKVDDLPGSAGTTAERSAVDAYGLAEC